MNTEIAALDAGTIGALLSKMALTPALVEVIDVVDSTNRYLLDRDIERGTACLAEAQTHGQGRRGRRWIASPYQNLMLSLAWEFPAVVPLSGLSLAAGLATVSALEQAGVSGLGLKWPNDIFWRGRKLGGLLVETRVTPNRPVVAVIGVGINVAIDPADASDIDQPWVDLREISPRTRDRNVLAAHVIERLLAMCDEYGRDGFGRFKPEWELRHVFQRMPVRLVSGERTFDGTVLGVDDAGALRVRDAGGDERVFHYGDVSLRSVTSS